MLEFVDAGHDLLLATDSDASDEIRELAADLGVDFDSKGSVVIDHFNRHKQGSEAVLTSNVLNSKAVFGSDNIQVTVTDQAVLQALLDAASEQLLIGLQQYPQ